MKTEERELTKTEFYTLLESAPDREADRMIHYTRMLNTTPWEYFQTFGIDSYGILIDDIPIYFACLLDEGDEVHTMWTLRNKDIKQQLTLFKLCKRKVIKDAVKYSPIFVTNNIREIAISKWNMRMGFIPYKVEDETVFYKFSGNNGGQHV